MAWINNYVREEARIYCLRSPCLNRMRGDPRKLPWRFSAYLPQLKHWILSLTAALSSCFKNKFISPCQCRARPWIIYNLWVLLFIYNSFLLILAIFRSLAPLYFITIRFLSKTVLEIIFQSSRLCKNLYGVDLAYFAIGYIIPRW